MRDHGAMPVPRLRNRTDSRPMFPDWPPFDDRRATPLYLGRYQYRKLVVLMDASVIPEGDLARWGKPYLLAGLLTHEVIKCFRYADDGPPAAVTRRIDSHMGEIAPGWAVISSDDGSGFRTVSTCDEHSFGEYDASGNAPEVAARDTSTSAYSDLDPLDAAVRRQADARAALVASAIGADLFITQRPYLHSMSWHPGAGATFVDVDDALAAVGLYLRAQGEHITYREPDSPGTHRMNRGLFFWVGARELLPSAWRWFAACVQHGIGSGDSADSALPPTGGDDHSDHPRAHGRPLLDVTVG